MAHLMNLEGVTVAAGARTVLDDLALGLDDGARVGIVGRNGDGKSTLMRIIAKTQEPDEGRVTHSRGLRVGMLSQTDDLDTSMTLREAVVGDVPDHTWASDPQVRTVLEGLLGDVLQSGADSRTVAALSGGQRRRIALARLLIGDHDVLMLDEPTNHLDVEGVAWLAEHLRARWPEDRGALLVVTHDRWFLDAVVDRTWEVHDGVVDSFDGGYAAYVLARAERDRVAATTAERRQNLLRKELAWLRRGAPARTSKPKFRIDAANALIADEPAPRDTLELARTASARQGKDVVDLEDITYSVPSTTPGGPPRVLLDGITWRLAPGERVGLVGVNGSGKTTLLRLLTGEIRPESGTVKRGTTVRAAVLSQHLAELAEVKHLRVLEAVEHEASSVTVVGKKGAEEMTAAVLVERLGFTAERAWTPVAKLSGGERRRLQLARLLIHAPNLLLLDEPTNDLDTDTLTAVEDVLDGFAGTLVVVSHDRYLLERTTDTQLALLGDGHLLGLVGGVEEYLTRRRQAIAAASGGAAAGALSEATPGAGGAGGSGAAGDTRAARKDMAKIERRLKKITELEKGLHEQMVTNAADHARLSALDGELRALADEKEQLEDSWMEAAELVG